MLFSFLIHILTPPFLDSGAGFRIVLHPPFDGKLDQFLRSQFRLGGKTMEGFKCFGRQLDRDGMVHLSHNVLQNITTFNSFFAAEAIHPNS